MHRSKSHVLMASPGLKRMVARLFFFRLSLALLIGVFPWLCRAQSEPDRLRLPAVGTLDVVFSPWQDGEALIIEVISSARHSIFVQAFLMTSEPIAKALIDAHRRGVAVEVLADIQMNGKGGRSRMGVLDKAGVPVWLETRYASAHNKVVLTDPHLADAVVLTGSYNFTYSARVKNSENILVLRGHPALAQAYLENWRRHQRDAIPWSARDEFFKDALARDDRD